jgi:methyl-accepting chemotaxis protein
VAAEVRKLAERSQGAAAEISQLSSSSVDVAERAGRMLEQIIPDIQKTAELVQEISAASGEQNSGADQINRAIQQLDHVIQQNASTAEEMSSTSEELSSQAQQLQKTMMYFKVKDGGGDFRNVTRGLEDNQGQEHETDGTVRAQNRKERGRALPPAAEGRREASDSEDVEFERF